jgi:hypothetical protein
MYALDDQPPVTVVKTGAAAAPGRANVSGELELGVEMQMTVSVSCAVELDELYIPPVHP